MVQKADKYTVITGPVQVLAMKQQKHLLLGVKT